MSGPQISVGSPVPQNLYPALATVLLAAGLTSTGSFFLYEVTKTKSNRALRSELLLALLSSVLLGLGTLFLLLWTGVFV
ncbi:Protein NEF1 [Tetrabaena socialis]|uniref:Dolichyl-diphosphooligosaccharide-protein glycosyltransferase subunit OST5 n=1 Tax=Tetrabaena socialis TaxID=47790 RepID=A0A2J8A1C9_9CHLO|nr:Protein NEF1 [Tetrabaena socialis]|eukprot:PNH06329.1 Protein NEF1 [Tetrabaena socialis]